MCSPTVKIRNLGLLSPSALSACVHTLANSSRWYPHLRCVDSIFTVEPANLALTATFDASAADDPIEFVFAPESGYDAVDFRRPPLHLKRIHALRTVSWRGIHRLCLLSSLRLRTRTLAPTCSKRFVRFAETSRMICTRALVHHSYTRRIDPCSFTRRKLKQLPIWDLWLTSEIGKSSTLTRSRKSLGAPCPAPPGATVLSSH
jgi:hypothetical protein